MAQRRVTLEADRSPCKPSGKREQFLLKYSDGDEPKTFGNIPELLEASFSRTSGKPAAEFHGAILSRAELIDRSERLASWLVKSGVGPGALVGIYIDRSIEMLVSVVAVLKSGAAYVPLDPAFPRIRNEQILMETRVPVLLTLARHENDLHSPGARILCVDREAAMLESFPLQPLPKIRSEMRAYVIFTSGSSGVPKGVEVSHGSVVNLLHASRELLGIGPQDRWFAITTLSFDISVLEILLPLVSGATVIVGSKETVADGRLLADQLMVSRASVLQATPVTFRMLLDVGFQPQPGFKMLCGGESWTSAMAERLLALGARLWNMYGPTETTVWSSITEIMRDQPKVVIGPPIANTQFYVVDEWLQEVPVGSSGELLIGGAGVALGYFRRDVLTAERFVANPNIPGERVYRTGDKVRRFDHGQVEFLGRLDQQIKLRGYRIELGEIEAAMVMCEGVRGAVAVLRQDHSNDPFLIGFYTASKEVPDRLFRESLAQRIPGYMVPRKFERLHAFPLTPNGKTDRKSLADYPLSTNSDALIAMHEAVSPIEMKIGEMWQKIFHGESIKSDSDFFELGGDSLLLVRLQSMISREFGLRLEAVDIETHFTVEKLAKWVELRQTEDGEPKPIPGPDPRLLPLQKQGAGKPIFILPQMMYFRSLAQELGTEQPVYAIQIKDGDLPERSDPASMGDLAQLYVRLIRQVQPTGPYRLGGWCLWGWVAYEVARLLEDQGEVVEILMIVDALAPGFWQRYSPVRQLFMKSIQLASRVTWMLIRLKRVSFGRRDKDRQRRLRTLAISMSFILPDRFRQTEYVTDTGRVEQLANLAARDYKPGPVKGKVLLFTSAVRRTGWFMGSDLGWGAVLGRPVHLNSLPGNHTEVFHPVPARIMAGHVREALGLHSEVGSHT